MNFSYYIVNPFWNHRLSLQSDWLSAVQLNHKLNNLCSKLHLFLSQWKWYSKTKLSTNHMMQSHHVVDMFSNCDQCKCISSFTSTDDGNDQNNVVLVFRLLNCAISKWMRNFGLKSIIWFQIELMLCTRSILKSCILFRTKLHSTQFNYHYRVLTLLLRILGGF